MGPLQNLIEHLKNLPPGDEPVSDEFKSGFDACIWEIQCYLNNQRSRGKLKQDFEEK